jgi:formylglycine-generating enzyme required for sulfatase activity
MSIETWLKTANLFELVPALREDCKLLKASLQGEVFDFKFEPTEPKWASLVANLKVPGESQDLFDANDLLQSRLRLIQGYQRGFSGLDQTLKAFVRSIEEAWSYQEIAIPSGQDKYAEREPAWIGAIEAESQGIAAAIRNVVNNPSHWSHPGVLMACDLLMKLMRIDREPELEVRTKVMFAFEHPKEPKGLLANLVIERLPNGSGLLIPHAAHCGLLWMPGRKEASFSAGLQTAWRAARRYLRSKQADWQVTHEDSGELLSYDWRWRLDLSGLSEFLGALWLNPIVPITGRSAETAIACALIAAAKHNPDSTGAGGSRDVDPLDPNIVCTATIDLTRDELPLGIVAGIKTKTLLREDLPDENTLDKERVYEVIVSERQPVGTIPDTDRRFKAVPVHTLADAYEQMVIYPRITRGVNRAIAELSRKDLNTYCTPYITPDIADVDLWQQAASKEPAEYTIYPPENAILNEETLADLMAGRLKYEPMPTRIAASEPSEETKAVGLQGNRIFIEGESGLGKSMFLLRCQHQIASIHDSLCLPVRFGKTTGNDSSLSQVDWSGLTTEKLLTLKQVSLPVEMFNRSLSEQKRPVVPWHSLVAWMDWLMKRGRVVLLLDALDQTHSQGVQQLGPKIAEQGWRQCPVIMTARPEAKFDRQAARVENDWQSLRIVPFDQVRWNQYLGTERIEQHVDEAILGIPLLLNMIKSLIEDDGKQSLEGQLKGMTRSVLYDRAIDHLIDRGEAIIHADKPELRNFAKSRQTVKKLLGEIAWVMFQSQGFVNQLIGDAYEEVRERLPSIDALSALEAIDITTSSQLIESTRASSGLSFRHRSFLEYFLAMYLARKPADTAMHSDSKGEAKLVPPLSDNELTGLIAKIHDAENGMEPSAWSVQAWSNTFRFLLTSCSEPNADSTPGFLGTETRDRDSVAWKLISHGNPWVVYEALERDKVEYSRGLESACRWLVHRDWHRFNYGYAVSETERNADDIQSEAKEIATSHAIDWDLMLDRRYRDGAYLSSLREIIEDKPFHAVYTRERGLLEALKSLPGGDVRWNFLDSFYWIDSGVFKGDGEVVFELSQCEMPAYQVSIKSFWISDFPVTNFLFELFCPSHRRERNKYSNRDDDPVMSVNWYMAMEFCDWLSTITGRDYSLPTDYEWEWAARGSDVGRKYWWGEEERMELNWCEESGAIKTRSRSESIATHKRVGLYHPTKYQRATGYGLLDLHGNVREWTSNSFYYRAFDPKESKDCHRFLVGGYFSGYSIHTHCNHRDYRVPSDRSYDSGFRVILR